MDVLRSDRQESHRCSQDRKLRYPDYLASGPGRSLREVQRLKQRINRSIVFLFHAQRNPNADKRTYENEDPIGIFLPALDHLVVFFFYNLGIYGEKLPRVITEVGFSLRWLIRHWQRVVIH